MVVEGGGVGVLLSCFWVRECNLRALTEFASQSCVGLSDKDDKKSCHDDRGGWGDLRWHGCRG